MYACCLELVAKQGMLERTIGTLSAVPRLPLPLSLCVSLCAPHLPFSCPYVCTCCKGVCRKAGDLREGTKGTPSAIPHLLTPVLVCAPAAASSSQSRRSWKAPTTRSRSCPTAACAALSGVGRRVGCRRGGKGEGRAWAGVWAAGGAGRGKVGCGQKCGLQEERKWGRSGVGRRVGCRRGGKGGGQVWAGVWAAGKAEKRGEKRAGRREGAWVRKEGVVAGGLKCWLVGQEEGGGGRQEGRVEELE
eukprot:366230-Chlamydomonas_euryale.AAC.25